MFDLGPDLPDDTVIPVRWCRRNTEELFTTFSFEGRPDTTHVQINEVAPPCGQAAERRVLFRLPQDTTLGCPLSPADLAKSHPEKGAGDYIAGPG